MAGVVQRAIDLATGNWSLGARIDQALPGIAKDQRRALIHQTRSGMHFRRSYGRLRNYSYASDQSGRGRGGLLGRGPRDSINFDLGIVKGQARHVARVNPHAAHAVSILRDWTVRSGPNIRPKPARKATAAKLDQIWKTWFLSSQCDASGHSNFYELTRLIVQSLFESGEVLVRLRPRKMSDGLAVPLAIEVLEGEFLYDGPQPSGVFPGNTFAAGIEFFLNKPVAYWLYKQHPQDSGPFDRTPVRVPVIDPNTGMKQIVHLFEKTRAGQIRGIPRAARALDTIYDQQDLRLSLLKRKRAEAKIVSFIKPPADASPDDPPPMLGVDMGETFSLDTGEAIDPPARPKVDNDELLEFVSSQLLLDTSVIPLPPGYDIKDSTFQNVADYSPFMADLHRTIATAFEIPYEIFSGDLKGVTYSSAKVGLLQFKAFIEAFQEYLTSELCEFVWQGFVLAGNRAGLWPETSIPCIFRFDRFPSVEPQKDLGVIILKLKNGLTSPRRACAELGEDFDEIQDEIAEDKAKLEKNGIDVFGALKIAALKTQQDKLAA